jgi:hypothetical protein
MRRLLRILFNVVTLLSLVLAAGVATLYVGSYWWTGTAGRAPVVPHGLPRRGSQWAVLWDSGVVAVELYKWGDGEPPMERRFGWRITRSTGRWRDIPAMAWPTIMTETGKRPVPGFRGLPSVTRIICGLWLPLLTFSILPLVWGVGAFQRARRRVAGACPSCGYDLRATPERCPECGATPAQPIQ